MGSTVSGSVVTTTVDGQLIGTSSSCISWSARSTTNSNAQRTYITGYANPPQGASVVTEGAVSLEQSGSVSYYDVSKVISGEHLAELDLLNLADYPGDSGGPTIYPSIYGPLAGGIVIGVVTVNSQQYIAIQLIDAELYTFSAFTGDAVLPNTSSTGTSC
jgi:hypothetical protein